MKMVGLESRTWTESKGRGVSTGLKFNGGADKVSFVPFIYVLK